MFTRIALVFSLIKLVIPVPFSCWHLRGTVRRRQWHPTPVLLLGKSHGRRSLQSMGWLRVGHDWATSLSHFTFMHWRRKWQPTPVLLPGESQGQRAWWASVYGVAQSRTWLKWLSRSSSSGNKRAALWPGRQAGRTLAAAQTIDCAHGWEQGARME